MNSSRSAALVLLAGGIALAGCGSASHVGSTTTTAVASPTQTVAVPTEAELKSALLTAGEIGVPFKVDTPAETPTESGTTSGCKALADAETSTAPGEVHARADFTAGDTGPFVTQGFTAAPESSFDRSLKEAKDGLGSCEHFTITYADGTALAFELTPINFAEGATAKRLDGTYHGVSLNGYAAVQGISRNVAMDFLYFQIGSGSSQDAYRIYTMAVAKAKRAFPS